MSKHSDLIKKVVKTKVGEKSTLENNPRMPWTGVDESVINETPLLNRYLKSRGINPEFATKDQKVAHSKTGQFKKWMIDHMNDPVTESMSMEPSPTRKRLNALKHSAKKHKEIRVADGHKKLHTEAVDKKDTVTFDIPLLIRVLEFAREDLNSDINLHKMVERLISMRGKGTLTMNQYGQIVKEEFEHLSEEQIDEISKELANRYMYSAKSDRAETDAKISKATEKQGKEWSSRRHKSIGKMLSKGEKRTQGISRALDRLTKEEVEQLDELSPALQHSYFKKAYAQQKDKTVPKETRKKRSVGMNKVVNRTLRRNTLSTPGAEQDFKDQEKKRGIGHVRDHVEVEGTVVEAKEANYGGGYQSTVLRVKELAKKKPVDMTSLAARMQASYKKDEKKPVKESQLEPTAACNQPWDVASSPDDTIKKSKKIKLILGGKKGAIKEDMYDHEKEDKSVAGLKKPKVQKLGVDDLTKEAPQAAAILKGGKTLTGEPRDTIEIDPMMKQRKQPTDSPTPDKPKKSV